MVQSLFCPEGSGWNNRREDEGTPVGKGTESQQEEGTEAGGQSGVEGVPERSDRSGC